MTNKPKNNVIKFPTAHTKKSKKDVIVFTPENFGKPGIEVKEFTFDLDGLKGAFEAKDNNWSELLSPAQFTQLCIDVVEATPKDDNVNRVHDASFEIQMLAEKYPEHAAYIEMKLKGLEKSLEFYIKNILPTDDDHHSDR